MARRRRFVWLALITVVLMTCACSRGDDGIRAQVIGRQGTLARGFVGESDRPWALTAEVNDGMLCLGLFGRSCVPIPDGKAPLEARLGESGLGTDGSYTCVYGAVSHDVKRVNVRFADGTDSDARIVPGQAWAADFYVLCIDRELRVSDLLLFDADGVVLDQ